MLEPEKPLATVMEDYLQAIYDSGLEKKVVRVRDIAGKMDVKMSTAAGMLKTLGSRELVEYEKYEYVELNPEGRKVAAEMHRRRETMRKFPIEIPGVDAPTAAAEAYKIEHALGSPTLDKFIGFMAIIRVCRDRGESCLHRFAARQASNERAAASDLGSRGPVGGEGPDGFFLSQKLDATNIFKGVYHDRRSDGTGPVVRDSPKYLGTQTTPGNTRRHDAGAGKPTGGRT
ncbi:MAG: metal-dependent transcriptional regulator [Pseudomonadota bacterium]